jgi:hypothetical protein
MFNNHRVIKSEVIDVATMVERMQTNMTSKMDTLRVMMEAQFKN